MTEVNRLIEAHTKDMVAAAMGYVFAKLSEDPAWIGRMDRSGSLQDAVMPDAETFMQHRGRFACTDLADEVVSALGAGMTS